MKKYISNGEWFKKDTEAYLLCELTKESGLFRGIRVCDDPASEGRKLGEEYVDEDGCRYDEFNIIEEVIE